MSKTIGSLVLYSVHEISEIMGTQERTITAYLRVGKLKGKKWAGVWYVTEEDLRDYFCTHGSEPEETAVSQSSNGQEPGEDEPAISKRIRQQSELKREKANRKTVTPRYGA